MKISKIEEVHYELDKNLEDYTIREISDYCMKGPVCSKCVFKFLCKHENGTERDMVEPAFWRGNADKFQSSQEFQLILKENYRGKR